jgi:hypothetical protein
MANYTSRITRERERFAREANRERSVARQLEKEDQPRLFDDEPEPRAYEPTSRSPRGRPRKRATS